MATAGDFERLFSLSGVPYLWRSSRCLLLNLNANSRISSSRSCCNWICRSTFSISAFLSALNCLLSKICIFRFKRSLGLSDLDAPAPAPADDELLDSDVLALAAAAPELGPAVLPNLLELDGGGSSFSCFMEKPPAGKKISSGGGAMASVVFGFGSSSELSLVMSSSLELWPSRFRP